MSKTLSKFLAEKESFVVTDIISEAISSSDLDRAQKLISSYLEKKLKTKMVRMPGVEEYVNSQDMGFGIRFFFTKKAGQFDSIRFNWKREKLDSSSVASVDFFAAGKHKHHASFEPRTSMAKVLPFIADFVEKPKNGNVEFIAESQDALITEASGDDIVDKIIDLVKSEGEIKLTKGKLYSLMKKNMRDEKPSIAPKLFDVLEEIDRATFITKKGAREYMVLDPDNLMKNKEKILAELVTNVKVSSGSSNETYKVDPSVESMANEDIRKLTFEQQLEDMTTGVKLVANNVSNAVFIGGRGGVGKTHNVEEALNDMGLSDGEGYFKNAGSISASGLYRLLYRHRKDIILFDDSDNVFGDQEARNVLKGATDTKPKRKLSWAKKSSDIVHPDDFTDEMEESGLVPSFFDFEGKIIFISNLPIDKLDPDRALRTRGFLFMIDPTDEEVYEFMKKIAPKMPLNDSLSLSDTQREEVVQLLQTSGKVSPNLRSLVRALNVRAGWPGGSGWESFVINYA